MEGKEGTGEERREDGAEELVLHSPEPAGEPFQVDESGARLKYTGVAANGQQNDGGPVFATAGEGQIEEPAARMQQDAN